MEDKLVISGIKEDMGLGGECKRATGRILVVTEMLCIVTVCVNIHDGYCTIASARCYQWGKLGKGVSLHYFLQIRVNTQLSQKEMV